MPAIDLNQLAKHYGRIEALGSITLSVNEGEIFGLLGPNGAGKTTLIRLLTGSTPPTGGRVRVLGLDPLRDSGAVRRQLGYMPQAPALYEDLSPRDNIRFFARAHDVPQIEKRIDELLDFSKLRARERDPVHTFSGGMKQRVSLACALAHRPRLLLLDEPTAGVDPRLRAEFWNHFRDLARGHEGNRSTLLISTHHMDEALLCDRLAILSDGRVLACGTPRELLDRGHTRVHIWRGSQESILETRENYAESLPQLLQPCGLDPAVTKLEIERDTLEQIVLRLIEENLGNRNV